MKRLIDPPVKRLRERTLASGRTAIWWEPEKAVRELGFSRVDLDETKLTWSRRQAEDLNRAVERARAIGGRQEPRARGRTVEDLIEDFTRSRKFLSKRDKTRQTYRDFFRTIRAKWGDHPVSQFTKPVMARWYETLYTNNGGYMALALIRHASILFKHAERLGWRPAGSNPCADLDLEVPPPRARVLSWAEVDALVAAADQLGHHAVATAILMSILQGQRQTDVLNARCTDLQLQQVLNPITGSSETVWIWRFVRSKRGNDAVMQLHPDLVERVSTTMSDLPQGAEFLLMDETVARPYADVPDLFRKRYAAARALAATELPDIKTAQFRDLRRTFGVFARQGGASKDDTGDVLGNSAAVNPRLGETYMPSQFWTASRAVLAVQRPKTKGRKKA